MSHPPDHSHQPHTDDAFPTQVAIDMVMVDESLSTLEKIYLYSRSQASFHKIYIAHALPSLLDQVSPAEAIEFVLPLLSGLAMDDDEQVKEALAAELVPLILWFFTRCQIIPDESTIIQFSTVTIPVEAFTPILGTLLLSPNDTVSGAARYAVVDILSKIKKADQWEQNHSSPSTLHSGHHDEDEFVVGLFGKTERALFEHEILYKVVVGMGRLDVDTEPDQDLFVEPEVHEVPLELGSGNSEVRVVTASECPSEDGDEQGVQDLQTDPEPKATVISPQDISTYYLPLSPTLSSSSVASTPSPSTDTTASSSSSSSPSAVLLDGTDSPSPQSLPPPPITTQLPLQIPQHLSTQYRSDLSSESQSPHQHQPSPYPSDVDRNLVHTYPLQDLVSGIEPTRSPSSNAEPVVGMQQEHETLDEHSVPPAPRPSHPAVRPPSPHPQQEYFPIDPTHSVDRSSNVGIRDMFPIPESQNEDDGADTLQREEPPDGEQAVVGRLSSMSLMAAVTASGSLGEDTKYMFVKEVERVGRDPVYWVRREALFVLGALAKVVPEELVLSSLLPLFESLRCDPVWHVRQSALFALPAILARLTPQHRRSLALETIIPLATDNSPPVRLGTLEALGEILFTFYQDEGGPPQELLQLFLGRREDWGVGDGRESLQDEQDIQALRRTHPLGSTFSSEEPTPLVSPSGPPEIDEASALESFYSDPARSLICAFNYPAVAMTLGRERWKELRELYLSLARNRAVKVRCTLAASLGELAKIIGEENASKDLLGIWWDAVRSEEEEIRSKAVECTEDFVTALGREARQEVVRGLLAVWEEGIFRDWREREGVAKAFVGLVELVGRDIATVLRELLRNALVDHVAAVREAAVEALPRMWSAFGDQLNVLNDLRKDIQAFGLSSLHRRRMTFVACQQALVLPCRCNQPAVVADDDFWKSLVSLSDDPIVGVRIGLARLVGTFCSNHPRNIKTIPDVLRDLFLHLSQDPSPEVRSYVLDPSMVDKNSFALPNSLANNSRKNPSEFLTFSRPPPPPARQHCDQNASRRDSVDAGNTRDPVDSVSTGSEEPDVNHLAHSGTPLLVAQELPT